MDCYYHNAVPSIALCNDCAQSVCATCRGEDGTCPGCRLKARIDAATLPRPGIAGRVGPSHPPPGQGSYRMPPPPPPQPEAAPAAPRRSTALAAVSPETRALLALGYPLWPLAALALLDPKRAPAVRREATQALAVNFGLFGMWVALEAICRIPLLGFSAWPLLAAIIPIWFVATTIFAVKAWNGDDVRVPLISDWLDEREERRASAA